MIRLLLLLFLQQPTRVDRGRFTVVSYPTDARLAASVLDWATAQDSFPGLPRPQERVVIAIAPDRQRFRQWIGPNAPEWGAAVAFPESHRIVMQGHSAGSDAGDPREVLRHELAHLALHESIGDLAPEWFDEGYASFSAHEWERDDALTANFALAIRGMPSLDNLNDDLRGGSGRATEAYALAYRAVAELAALDQKNGLTRFFDNWRTTGSLERAVRTTYGITLTGFEAEWQSRTRRRYGGLALVGNVTVGGVVIAVLLIPLYAGRRRRQRERLEAMQVAEDASDWAEEDDPVTSHEFRT